MEKIKNTIKKNFALTSMISLGFSIAATWFFLSIGNTQDGECAYTTDPDTSGIYFVFNNAPCKLTFEGYAIFFILFFISFIILQSINLLFCKKT